GALLATAEAPNPGRRRHGLAVPCPNTLVAVALVGLARRLGAAAHVSTHHGREHTHLTDPTAIATLLTPAGGPAAATPSQPAAPRPPRPAPDQRHRRRPPPAAAGPRQPHLNPARHMTISPRSTPVW